MIFIGIDPGGKGGISVICEGHIVYPKSYSYSNEQLKKVCNTYRHSVFCTVELVHSRPTDSKKGAFSFGKNFGYILGVLESYNIPYKLVSPQKWKREYDLIGKDKQASIDCAKLLFPTVDFRPTDRCKKESDGMCESMLIGEYGRRYYAQLESKD